MISKRLVQMAGVAAGAIGTAAAMGADNAIGRRARRVADRFGKELRYVVSSAPGIAYRLGNRQPDPDVPDDVLTDRIRSSLGPIEKRLDVPRIQVMVEDRIATLHGNVPDVRTAGKLELAVLGVSGVRGVESHLHVGLTPGDTRPSEGAAAPSPDSDALVRLVDAARTAGASAPRRAVHAVLCAFAERLPADEREHVMTHLPDDVRTLIGPPRRFGEQPRRLRTIPELVTAALSEGGMDAGHAPDVTRAVVGTLRELVPEEQRDVSAVLPEELRMLWERAPAH
jgi:uncharacterized protein (DUF2267 family)